MCRWNYWLWIWAVLFFWISDFAPFITFSGCASIYRQRKTMPKGGKCTLWIKHMLFVLISLTILASHRFQCNRANRSIKTKSFSNHFSFTVVSISYVYSFDFLFIKLQTFFSWFFIFILFCLSSLLLLLLLPLSIAFILLSQNRYS